MVFYCQETFDFISYNATLFTENLQCRSFRLRIFYQRPRNLMVLQRSQLNVRSPGGTTICTYESSAS